MAWTFPMPLSLPDSNERRAGGSAPAWGRCCSAASRPSCRGAAEKTRPQPSRPRPSRPPGATSDSERRRGGSDGHQNASMGLETCRPGRGADPFLRLDHPDQPDSGTCPRPIAMAVSGRSQLAPPPPAPVVLFTAEEPNWRRFGCSSTTLGAIRAMQATLVALSGSFRGRVPIQAARTADVPHQVRTRSEPGNQHARRRDRPDPPGTGTCPKPIAMVSRRRFGLAHPYHCRCLFPAGRDPSGSG